MIIASSSSRPVFHRSAVLNWGRGLGLKDDIALKFIESEGAIIIDDSQPRNLVPAAGSEHKALSGKCMQEGVIS
jgi:hypothetical protein